LYGPIITFFVTASYFGSIPFWWNAGKDYEKFMKQKDADEKLKFERNKE
jgi:hypothetical protein